MQLYFNNWYDSLLEELSRTETLKIISPFVKEHVIRNIQSKFDFSKFELITRFNLQDFASNVSSLEALTFAIENQAKIFGVRQLHSKVYLFDTRSAIITSANLTNGGLLYNHECGIYITEQRIIEELQSYFTNLKMMAGGAPLSLAICDIWKHEILSAAEVHNSFINSLPDYGAFEYSANKEQQYFVKFFGTGADRVMFNFEVKDEVERALCHYACCFSKTPKKFNTGDIIYMARMTSPNDFAIFGRATAICYKENRDEASEEEIAQRYWKETWPLYVRVQDSVFINGVMGDCVMLYDLIRELDFESFESTRRRYDAGERKINPYRSLSQQAYVKLTSKSALWLESRFSQVLQRKGNISDDFIQSLPKSTVDINLVT